MDKKSLLDDYDDDYMYDVNPDVLDAALDRDFNSLIDYKPDSNFDINDWL